MPLSLAFFGNAPFALPIATLLHRQGFLRLLVTQDETALWQEHIGNDIEIRHPPDTLDWDATTFDAIVTANYGILLPRKILQSARLGSYNVHASLLPRWRGASPIQQAILQGDSESGVSVIRMNECLDRGEIVLCKHTPLHPQETYNSLEMRLSQLGAEATSELLELLAGGEVCTEAQDDSSSCWAKKLRREDGLLDWHASAEHLERQVRAFVRWPGSFFFVRGERIVVHAACIETIEEKVSGDNQAGRVLRTHPHPVVACGERGSGGALGLLRLQRAGRKVLEASTFLRGFPLETGANLST